MSFDLYLFNLTNKCSGKKKWLDALNIFFAKYLIYILVVVLAALAYYERKPEMFFLPFIAGLFSRFIINELIYIFYKRKRPLEALNIKSLINKPNYPAFPSGHASFSFAISFCLFPFNLSLAIIFLVLSFLIGMARIFSGVHWPSDILAGIIVGAFSAAFINLIFKFL